MMRFRKLTPLQAVKHALLVLQYARVQHLRDFLDDFFGEQAYRVSVEVESGRYGLLVKNIQVSTPDGEDVSPDFALAGWQALFAENEHFNFDRRDAAEDCLFQHGIYLTYGISPDPEEDLLIPEKGANAPPDMYVSEGRRYGSLCRKRHGALCSNTQETGATRSALPADRFQASSQGKSTNEEPLEGSKMVEVVSTFTLSAQAFVTGQLTLSLSPGLTVEARKRRALDRVGDVLWVYQGTIDGTEQVDEMWQSGGVLRSEVSDEG